MKAITSYEGWVGTDAVDVDGDKIGGIEQIYYDEQTGRPEWLAVRTGFFGMNRTFVPISGATVWRDDDAHEHLRVPYTKQFVKNAPNVDPYGSMTTDEEQVLFDYYDFDYTARRYGDNSRFDANYQVTQPANGEVEDEAEMTAAEERLRVGTETVETGRARLRKYVVTEHQTVTVPTTREEVRVEREPLNADDANTRRNIADGEESVEMMLHEERPVVSKETVPREKVRLVKETVTEDQTVDDDVRKEQIEVDGDTVKPRR